MSLNKKRMVREIGRRTRLRNRDVALMLDALIEVWTEELVRGGRIEVENFLVLESDLTGSRVRLRLSKRLRRSIDASGT